MGSYVALFDFQSRTEHEVNLRKYEIVVVVYQPTNVPGFYYGRTEAGAGLFPTDYVAHLDTCTATRDQDGTDRLLQMRDGEKIVILKKEVGGDKNWWKGINQSDQVGLFPASAVNHRPTIAPVVPSEAHVPGSAATMRGEDEYLRRGDNLPPAIPATLHPGAAPATLVRPASTQFEAVNYDTLPNVNAPPPRERPTTVPPGAMEPLDQYKTAKFERPASPRVERDDRFQTAKAESTTIPPPLDSSQYLDEIDITPLNDKDDNDHMASGVYDYEVDDQSDSEEEPSGCSACTHAIETAMARFFYKIGRFDGRCPCLVMLLCILFAALCGLGLSNFTPESRGDKLWIPQGTEAIENSEFVSDNFEAGPRFQSVIMQTPGEISAEASADNILTKEHLLDALTVEQRIRGVRVPAKFDDNNVLVAVEDEAEAEEILEFSRLCLRVRGGACARTSPLKAWNYDRTRLANDDDVLATLNAALPDSDITGLLGAIEYGANGTIVGARAMQFTFLLQNNFVTVNGAEVDERADLWEEAVLNVTRGDLTSYETLEVFPALARSQGDEFGNAISGDVTSLTVGMMLIIVYTAIMLGSRPFVYSRVLLAMGGVLSIGLAILVSFGLASAFGIFYGPVQSVLPFLLLGIGVDDMFVIVAAFDRTDPDDEIEERTGQALASAGVSISVTSFTDAIAFGIGAITVLPALEAFCLWAVLGVIGIWIMQITFFTALVSLDGRRMSSERIDCCPCFTACGDGCSGDVPDQTDDLKREGPCCFNLVPFYYFAKFITHKVTRCVIILFSIALFGVSVYLATGLKQEFQFDWFIPPGSYLLDNSAATEEYFSRGPGLSIYGRDIDYFTSQQELADVFAAAKASNWTVDEDVTGWLPSFQARQVRVWGAETAANMGRDEWRSNLTFFLATEGSRYNGDIVFNDDDEIVATRFSTRLKRLNSSQEQVDAMTNVRADVAAVLEADGLTESSVFPFSFNFLFWEQYAVIYEEGVRNLSLSLAAVFVISLLLLPQPVVAICVFLCVLFSLVDTLGVLYIVAQSAEIGTGVDSVVVVFLVLSVGLAIDYSAHIGHAFLEARGGRRDRAREALVRIGPSVINGGFSTFLAAVVLAGSQSYVFVTFFKIITSIVVFGLFHGLIFLPAMLAFMGPNNYRKAVGHEMKTARR